MRERRAKRAAMVAKYAAQRQAEKVADQGTESEGGQGPNVAERKEAEVTSICASSMQAVSTEAEGELARKVAAEDGMGEADARKVDEDARKAELRKQNEVATAAALELNLQEAAELRKRQKAEQKELLVSA